jgi:hypothetical protein
MRENFSLYYSIHFKKIRQVSWAGGSKMDRLEDLGPVEYAAT